MIEGQAEGIPLKDGDYKMVKDKSNEDWQSATVRGALLRSKTSHNTKSTFPQPQWFGGALSNEKGFGLDRPRFEI